MTVKNVNEMDIDELEDEHFKLRKRILSRRERIEAAKPLSKRHCKKLLALCNELYGDIKIP